ncbi:AmmeMemoRadiSam system radical SAM enzyme [Candidatus Wirthbacteria bacterium CG2_30_54_11]|uniref:AmmeMemoRadiSam system radical SAM enzyme n=1 Tax=Candidatus Wirthbacteria bacterium CG2_30_54_11 TaxID=1817892 RepID=A0A1J5IW89_9BACT|nr:MAG: AmmeMemoRadiSam system radical SAM enzyme [Candidatus Wirthbacteria bacterium CG2_30_54_11]
MYEAQFYEKIADKKVRCNLCAHHCIVKNSARGICGVRENQGGTLYTLTYNRLISASIDPVEKKPLYHFLPGSRAYSFCTMGCNFGCMFCQNADISQAGKTQDGSDKRPPILGDDFPPASIVKQALKSDCQSIAYTYSEPTVFYEYMFDTARLASEKGLKNIFVTNGYITEEPLRKIAPYIQAANIDLKSFSDDFYARTCKARLQPVLETIKRMHDLGIWIELTTLLMVGENDSPDEIHELARWIAGISKDIPWHVSAFHPAYKMQDLPPTPVKNIVQAIEIGRAEGLHNVYAGNIGGDEYQNTVCSACGSVLIERTGSYQVTSHLKKNRLQRGSPQSAASCPSCKAPVAVRL